MIDTLKSIAESWEREFNEISSNHFGDQRAESIANVYRLCAQQIRALQAEMEKCNLVEKWREIAALIDDGTQVTQRSKWAHDYRQRADELSTWLVANSCGHPAACRDEMLWRAEIEKAKAEARLEEAVTQCLSSQRTCQPMRAARAGRQVIVAAREGK